jgi:hypothetical protein
MGNILSSLGLNAFDVALLFLCPVGGVIGSFAHAIMLSIHPEQPPNKEGEMYLASKELQEARGVWIGLRLILGGILGFVIGLYFIGSIQESASTVAKIMALSVLAGYAAPKIWVNQEKSLVEGFKIVEKDINRENGN